jgi:hypothetical protein
MAEEDTYLGDGLYASFDGFQIRLYASNGVSVTNEVFLDGVVARAFVRFMAHKGMRPDPPKREIGPTGTFPDGKISPDDQGGMKVAIGIDSTRRLIRLEFGGPVAWMAIPPEAALELALLLTEKAAAVERMNSR